ncbi:alpha/beta hydrolase [Rhizobium sp. Root1204]|nr:alpha/beta hydrolase [Rhizobium sp. Root1204]
MKLALVTAVIATPAVPAFASDKPPIVLVHGAFADSSSWNGVIERLEKDGYSVTAIANPLRGVKSDAEYVRSFVASLKTSVVLVGHSYGGSVISEAAKPSNVKALVYVAAFAPEVGENAVGLSGKFPGGTLGDALQNPVSIPGGGSDLYIQQAKFHDQFAADVPAQAGELMAATQRPIAASALAETATKAAWKDIPSWFIYGDADKNIPEAALSWMAERAKSKKTVVVKGASHVVMVSNADKVAELVEEAAAAK